MSYYKPLTRRNRGNQKASQPLTNCQGDKKDADMGRHQGIHPKTNDIKPFIWPYNQPPTFSGAKYWVNRHQRDFKTFAHLLELYPNLLQSEGLGSLREFMIPPDNLPNHVHISSNPSQFYTQNNSDMTHGPSMNTRFVYICDNTSLTDFGVSSAKDKLVAALSSYCCVRTSPEQLGSYSECIDIVDIITAADAFVFLMNSRTLNSWFSLHQLGLAIAHEIPVIAVREAGFKLPPVFPPEFHHLEIVKPDSVGTAPRASPHFSRSKSSEVSHRTELATKDVNSHNNEFFSDSELLKRSKQRSGDSPLLLANVISDLFRTSLLYVWHLHDSCIAKLFGRLSDFLGESFLDLEISQTQTENNCDNLLLVGNDHSIAGSTSPFRPLPSQQNQSSMLDMPAERKSHTTRSSVGNRDKTLVASADISRTPSSSMPPTDTSLKLPPIPTIVGVSVTPSPVPPSRHSTHSTSSVRSSEGTSSRSTKSTAPTVLPKVRGETLPDTIFNMSPPSSPFLETRYMVFPTEPGGPKKSPYVVCFPGDVINEEENLKKTIDEDSEHEYKLPEETEDNFDKIRLDVSSEELIEDHSPFSSPTLCTEVSSNKGRGNIKYKRNDVFKSNDKSKVSQKVQGQTKAKTKPNSINANQNKHSNLKHDKDKQVVKVSHVDMKFRSNGKTLKS